MPAKLPDYGVDAPGAMKGLVRRGAIFVILGSVGALLLRDQHPNLSNSVFQTGLWSGVFQLLGAAFMIWSSRVGKMRLRDRLLNSIKWRGDEMVLDVGCGRGLALIGAAKRAPSGHAVGIDIWSKEDLSANGPDATLANARAEGVAERITIDTGDARQLPYPDEHFDTVVSMTALHNIPAREDRERALAEILRVLKPGGQLALFDIFHAGSYAKTLKMLGGQEIVSSGIVLLWFIPGRRITARKEQSSVAAQP